MKYFKRIQKCNQWNILGYLKEQPMKYFKLFKRATTDIF